jgi:hypothetical protein
MISAAVWPEEDVLTPIQATLSAERDKLFLSMYDFCLSKRELNPATVAPSENRKQPEIFTSISWDRALWFGEKSADE